MRRREFIGLVGGAATTWPLAAYAQQLERIRRLGVLISGPAEADLEGQARVAALRLGLLEHGWIEGRNLEVTYRCGGSDTKQLRAYAAELVALKPDILFASPSGALAEAQRATRNIPIVFPQITDPVGAGFVASLAHPGGNITGFAVFEFALGAKWLELLKQIVPSITRVVVIYDPVTPSATGFLPLIQAAGRSLGVDVFVHSVSDGAEIEHTISTFAAEPNGSLIAVPSSIVPQKRDLIASLAIRNNLPSASAFRSFSAAGGLVTYGVDNVDLHRRAASYIDRILRGEKPSDLPVQEATKFQLILNAKTAKALDLTFPPSLLAAADEVIE